MADRGLDKKRQQFEDAQLKELAVPVDTTKIEEVLASAEAIGMISKDVVKKITDDKSLSAALGSSFAKTFGNAEKAAMASLENDSTKTEAEKTEIARTKAFREAFRMVYGRFMLESAGNALEDIGKPSADRLKEVLKFSIEDKDKLKGRSELQAALSRLKKASVSDPTKVKDKIKAKVAEAETKFTEAKTKNQSAVDKVKSFENTSVQVTLKEAKDLHDLPLDTVGDQDYSKYTTDVLSKISLVANSADLSPEIKEFCDKYLKDYKPGTNTKEIEDFYVDSLGNFLDELAKKITEYFTSNSKSAREEQKKTEEELAEAEKKLDAAKKVTFESTIIDAAFPKAASGAEIKGFERKLHDAEHAEHHLQDVYKYFSTAENLKKVTTSYHDLSALTKGVNFNENDPKDTLNKRISKKNQEIKGKTVRRDYLAKILAKVSDKKENQTGRRDETMSEGDVQKNTDAMGDVSAEISAAEEELEQLNEIRTMSKAWKADLTKLVENLEGADHAKVDFEFKYKDKNGIEQKASLKEIAKDLKAINPSSGNFNPSSLINLYEKFGDFFENHKHEVDHLLEKFDKASADASKATKDAKKNLEKANEKAEKTKNLSDADAAKKIIGALVYEQFPDMSPMDHNKLVTMILAEDVATLQTDEGYEALAQRGTAEAMETGKFANVSARLLNFKYKEGDKVVQPLKGIKPDDLKDWESIEKLFTFGKLNYKNAFFILVAFQDFDGDVKSIQSVKLEKKLKTLLAKQMGVDAHMDKAGISKVVDDAFKAQMEKVKPLMKAHFSIVETKGGKAKENKKKVLDMKYEDLNDQFRSGKFSSEIYDHKLEALIKEAKEADVNVEFSADTTGAKYWNSPYAQWLKDKAHDAGSFVGKKALAAGVFAPLKIAGKGLWGATKLGTALGFQTTLLPVRAAKYPLLLAAKPIVGFINLFRANKWTPLPGLRDSVKNDTARIMGYAKGKASGVVKGTAETVTSTVSGEWGKVKYADSKYEDRNKKKAGERAELMKIYEPKSDLEAIEVPDSPFVDLAKYKKQIDMVATALGIKIDAPHGAEVKVGHEEKKDDHAKPHDAAHGAHDAHAEKKDDHAKPDQHAEKKDDHAKPAHH